MALLVGWLQVNTAALMIGATGLTVARMFVPVDPSGNMIYAPPPVGSIARAVIGGVFATAGLLVVDGFAPGLASGLAVVIFLTSFLVNGYALAVAANTLIK